MEKLNKMANGEYLYCTFALMAKDIIKELEESDQSIESRLSALEESHKKSYWVERFTTYNTDAIDLLEDTMDEILDRIAQLEKSKPTEVCDRCNGTGIMCICRHQSSYTKIPCDKCDGSGLIEALPHKENIRKLSQTGYDIKNVEAKGDDFDSISPLVIDSFVYDLKGALINHKYFVSTMKITSDATQGEMP